MSLKNISKTIFNLINPFLIVDRDSSLLHEICGFRSKKSWFFYLIRWTHVIFSCFLCVTLIQVIILISVSLIYPTLCRPLLHRSVLLSLARSTDSVYYSITPSRLSHGRGSNHGTAEPYLISRMSDASLPPAAVDSIISNSNSIISNNSNIGNVGEGGSLPETAVPPPPAPSRAALVICGPSGVGKDTIRSCLQQRFPNIFGYSVSHTTRRPRPDEINGVHYHFVNSEVCNDWLTDCLTV